VLNAIYEEDFLEYSYGFRPKRGQHDALDALVVGISSMKVNYVCTYGGVDALPDATWHVCDSGCRYCSRCVLAMLRVPGGDARDLRRCLF
jgi:hypothetical protein